MATKRKKTVGNPALSLRSIKMRRSMTSAFNLVRDLEGHISSHNHTVLQGSALALMHLVDPEGILMIVIQPKAQFDHARVTKRTLDVMKNCVELTKNPGDLTDVEYVELRSATIGFMFAYSELAGLPDPVDVVFKDMVVDETDKAWDNKPANQNVLLRRKVNA